MREVLLVQDEKRGYPKLDDLNRQHCETGPAVVLIPEGLSDEDYEKNWAKMIPDGDENGIRLYYWHGLEIPMELAVTIIENPANITTKFIDSLENIEIRRVALERFGFGRYLEESECEILDRDVDKMGRERILVKKALPNDTTLIGVFVTNSSPNGRFEKEDITWKPIHAYAEHDRARILRKYENTGDLKDVNGVVHIRQVRESGTFIPDLDNTGKLVFKKYFLPVDEQIRPFWFRLDKEGNQVLDQDKDPVCEYGEPQKPTCHNAVASTFGLYGEEYDPDVET